MGYSFYVDSRVQEDVNNWLYETMSLPNNYPGDRLLNRRFIWFPHYRIGEVSAIRVDIRENDDSLVFKLAWSNSILHETEYK